MKEINNYSDCIFSSPRDRRRLWVAGWRISSWTKRRHRRTERRNPSPHVSESSGGTARCGLVGPCLRSNGSSHRSFMVDPLSYFMFQPVLHDWCNKGCDMCYPVCWMVHIKEPLLLIGKSSPCGGSGFPL